MLAPKGQALEMSMAKPLNGYATTQIGIYSFKEYFPLRISQKLALSAKFCAILSCKSWNFVPLLEFQIRANFCQTLWEFNSLLICNGIQSLAIRNINSSNGHRGPKVPSFGENSAKSTWLVLTSVRTSLCRVPFGR